MAGLQHPGHRCLLTCGDAILMAPTAGLASPTEIPQVRVPGRPHRYPTDTAAFRGTLRHSCKLGKITTDDTDGYHRVMCPAVMGKIRCPLRPASMTLDRNRPEILTPPEHPPDCCTQQTITVPPEVNAKTAQKHDYPSAAHRKSYARRTGAERTFSTAKDPASNNIARGWTRLMGLSPIMLWLACLLAVRNQRILTAWDARQADNARRATAWACPKTRRRRRKTLASLDRLEAIHDLKVLVPAEPDRALVHRVIYDELVQGVISDASRRHYLEIIGRLTEAGAEGVIAGCTEIELLVTADDAGLPYFPTTQLHAKAAVDLALARDADLPFRRGVRDQASE